MAAGGRSRWVWVVATAAAVSSALSALSVVSVGSLVAAGCGEQAPAAEDTSQALPLEVLSVEGLLPLLEGGDVVVSAAGADPGLDGQRTLAVSVGGLEVALAEAPAAQAGGGAGGDGALRFTVTAALVDALGGGQAEAEVRLREGDRESAPLVVTLTAARALPIRLDEPISYDGFREDGVVLRGDGFLAPGEGEVVAALEGALALDAGGEVAVTATLPVSLADASARTRGLLRLSTDLGGVQPGVFTGTIRLTSTLRGGATAESPPQGARIGLSAPALTSLAPAEAHLGQRVTFSGGGLLGAPDRPGETTLLRLEGTWAGDGGDAQPLAPREVAARWQSGQAVQLDLDVEVAGDALTSTVFPGARGVFAGTVTPVTLRGVEEVAGAPLTGALRLVGPRQVVQVVFLPGFYSSLSRFGLGIASAQVIDRILQRLGGIYAGYAVTFSVTPPDDAMPSAVTVLEIGGADPNGLGMFGYDNTPGKDIGNLRLFDRIGGANASSQEDGFPGYGGVFIDSILYWSSHPELEGDPPASSPPADPLFDEVFDPLRAQPATLAEVLGDGDPARVAQAQRAVDVLGAVIGETAAHELGHSLGLSQPYGLPTDFHSVAPGEGCLMDSGAHRPFGERAAQPGFPASRFCDEEPAYLEAILGLPR